MGGWTAKGRVIEERKEPSKRQRKKKMKRKRRMKKRKRKKRKKICSDWEEMVIESKQE